MWILNNDTGFVADQTFLGDRDLNDTYILAVKATFDVGADGTCTRASDQAPVDHAPRPLFPDRESSLAADTDFDFMKRGTDIVVLGSAINPDPSGRGDVTVGLKVGPVEKRLRVCGQRVWLHSALGPLLSDPEPFREMPVIWENAFGGADRGRKGAIADDRNPVGTGFAEGAEGIEGLRAPTIFAPAEDYQRWTHRPLAAGFGPVARHWRPRRDRAGTYDQAWQDHRAPQWPLDLDPRFFQAAPDDQQAIPPLRGTEEVRVVNMTEDGFLGFRLPQFRPYANILVGRESVQVRLWLATLAIYPGARRIVETWLATFPCQGRREKIVSIDVWDKPLVRIAAGTAPTEEDAP